LTKYNWGTTTGLLLFSEEKLEEVAKKRGMSSDDLFD